MGLRMTLTRITKDSQGNCHYRGIVVAYNVKNGGFILFISTEYLKERLKVQTNEPKATLKLWGVEVQVDGEYLPTQLEVSRDKARALQRYIKN